MDTHDLSRLRNGYTGNFGGSYPLDERVSYLISGERDIITQGASWNSFLPSYISEAAASLLDERLSLNIVPRTQLVSLSSQVLLSSASTPGCAELYEGLLLRLARQKCGEEGEAITREDR